MLKLSKTYEVITEESAADGEAEESGFEWQGVEHSFTETVQLLKHREPSQWPITNPASCWFTEYGEADYRTGDVENNSIHYDRDNNPRSLKYWKAAIIAAGHRVKF